MGTGANDNNAPYRFHLIEWFVLMQLHLLTHLMPICAFKSQLIRNAKKAKENRWPFMTFSRDRPIRVRIRWKRMIARALIICAVCVWISHFGSSASEHSKSTRRIDHCYYFGSNFHGVDFFTRWYNHVLRFVLFLLFRITCNGEAQWVNIRRKQQQQW